MPSGHWLLLKNPTPNHSPSSLDLSNVLPFGSERESYSSHSLIACLSAFTTKLGFVIYLACRLYTLNGGNSPE